MRSFASITIALVLAACGGKSKPPPPPDNGGSGSGSDVSSACPASRPTTDVCAAVITYAKATDGTCCQYPSPCAVPIEGQQYSDDKCTQAMGPAK